MRHRRGYRSTLPIPPTVSVSPPSLPCSQARPPESPPGVPPPKGKSQEKPWIRSLAVPIQAPKPLIPWLLALCFLRPWHAPQPPSPASAGAPGPGVPMALHPLSPQRRGPRRPEAGPGGGPESARARARKGARASAVQAAERRRRAPPPPPSLAAPARGPAGLGSQTPATGRRAHAWGGMRAEPRPPGCRRPLRTTREAALAPQAPSSPPLPPRSSPESPRKLPPGRTRPPRSGVANYPLGRRGAAGGWSSPWGGGP